MRFMKAGPWFVVTLFMSASLANAQSTTGTISGRVIDAQQLPVPGVTVTFAGPGTGAGVTFSGGATATTNAQGQASINVTAAVCE